MTADGGRLGDQAAIRLTEGVIREYARHWRIPLDRAERELAEILRSAIPKPATPGSTTERWRARSTAFDTDITARIDRRNGVATVVYIHVRRLNRR